MIDLKRFLLFACVIKLTLAINTVEFFSNRQGIHQYGQLQPVPDPPRTPSIQEGQVPDFLPTAPEIQPPEAQNAAEIAAEQAAQQAAAQQAAAQQAAAQQAAAQQAGADAALQQATFQCDQTIMGRDFEYSSALNLIQNEDYLSDADIDELRFFKRQGNIHSRHRRASSTSDDTTTTTTTPSPLHSPEHLAAGVGAVALITLAMNPPPTNIPGNAPQPGSPGGGALPSANPGNLALLAIPAGLAAVAIFPPFDPAKPRTPGIDAQAAIFKEAAASAVARRRSYRQPSLKDRFLKNVRCLIPRLKAKFGRKSNSVSDYGYGKKKRDTGYGYQYHEPRYGYHQRAGYGEPEECGTIEDCFDLPCPRFGVAVKLSFTRRGPPTRNNYNEIRRHFQSRQTGEGFTSASPPDCRVINY